MPTHELEDQLGYRIVPARGCGWSDARVELLNDDRTVYAVQPASARELQLWRLLTTTH